MKTAAFKKEQVKKDITYRILSGQYPLAGRIPPERALCTLTKTSRMTVRAAINDLIEEGILQRNDRRGTLIKKMPDNELCNAKQPKHILFIYFSSIKGHPVEQWGASSRLYHGIEHFANAHELALLIQSGENFLRQPAISHNSIDGIIVGGSQLEKHLPQLMKLGVPVVVADALPYMTKVDAVCADYYEAGICAGQKVMECKYENPLLLVLRYEGEDFIQSSFISAQKGFQDFLRNSPITIHQYTVDYKDILEYEHLKSTLDMVIKEKVVDCIIDCSGITDSYNIPNIPVINTSGMGKADPNRKDYTQILFNMERIGYLAMQRLYERIQNPYLETIRYLVPVKN